MCVNVCELDISGISVKEKEKRDEDNVPNKNE